MTPHEGMLAVLVLAALFIIITFWRAHRNHSVQFNALDLIMVDGKVDKIATAFMLVLGVSTWVIIDQQIKGKLTEGMFGLWLTAWVAPLVAKVVFGKSEMPGSTISTTITQQSTEVKP